MPLKLEYCHTRLARGEEVSWIAQRFTRACAELGTTVTQDADGRLVVGGSPAE